MEPWMKPMLCDRADSLDGFDPATWAAEAKMDGWRAICHVGTPIGGDVANGLEVKVYGGRNASDYSGQVPYLEVALAQALPPDSVVDGELLSSSGWGGVQGAMTRNGCGDQSIYIVIFDVLRVDGQDVRKFPWTDRRQLVEAIQTSDKVRVSPVFEPSEAKLDAVLQAGFEGLVLKRKSSRYVNSRSPSWVKVKPQETAEAKVIGFKPGQGSFAGMIGAIEFEMLDTGAKSRCSGFDMALRREITANQDQWLGQIIEIKHHGIGKEGKPRHPQYLRRRDDRTASEVTGGNNAISPPPKKRTRRSDVPQYRMRNYGAMNDAKLLRCVAELEARAGDAYERCVSKGGDPAADLAEARRVAAERELR